MNPITNRKNLLVLAALAGAYGVDPLLVIASYAADTDKQNSLDRMMYAVKRQFSQKMDVDIIHPESAKYVVHNGSDDILGFNTLEHANGAAYALNQFDPMGVLLERDIYSSGSFRVREVS